MYRQNTVYIYGLVLFVVSGIPTGGFETYLCGYGETSVILSSK